MNFLQKIKELTEQGFTVTFEPTGENNRDLKMLTSRKLGLLQYSSGYTVTKEAFIQLPEVAMELAAVEALEITKQNVNTRYGQPTG